MLLTLETFEVRVGTINIFAIFSGLEHGYQINFNYRGLPGKKVLHVSIHRTNLSHWLAAVNAMITFSILT